MLQWVRGLYLASMGKLQNWMDENGWRDHHVADRVNCSRVHVTRIRNGLRCSVPLAKRLKKLTGIRWTYFADPPAEKKRAAK